MEIFVSGKEWVGGTLIIDMFVTTRRVLCGFVIGAILGIVVGSTTSLLYVVKKYSTSYMLFFRSIAPVALAPFFIIFFGIGELSKIVLIAWGCFFIVWLATHNGICNIDKKYVDASKLLRMNKVQMFYKLYLSAALPQILTGVRLSLSFAFILVFVGEALGAESGVGHNISIAYSIFRADIMIVGLIVLGILGSFFDFMVRFISNKLFPWLVKQ